MKRISFLYIFFFPSLVNASEFDDIAKHISKGNFGKAFEVTDKFTSYIYDDARGMMSTSEARNYIRTIKENKDYCDNTKDELNEEINSDELKLKCSKEMILSNRTFCEKRLDLMRKINSDLKKKCLSSNSEFNYPLAQLQKHSSTKIDIGINEYKAASIEAISKLKEKDEHLNSIDASNQKIQEAQEEKEKHEKEKQEKIGWICQFKQIISFNEKEIEKEKKVGQRTGFVNASRLNELGKGIASLEDNIEIFKGKLRKEHNHEFKDSDCK